MESEKFELYLDFRPSTGDPSRAFHALGDVIDALHDLDLDLARIISPHYQPVLVLDKVDGGSIRATISDIVRDIPDDALKEANIRRVIGHFLLKAKYVVLKWCDETKKIESIDQVRQLERELVAIAEETDAKMVPAYSPIETHRLLGHINSIQMALKRLDDEDLIEYRSRFGIARFNGTLAISSEIIREVLTREVISKELDGVVKVKKPDYLGNSKWGFRFQGHTIEAKVRDSEWLFRFQNKLEPVQPGDSLKVKLKQDISYGYEGEIVHISYEVLRVAEVIPAPRLFQQDFFGGDQ
jgi:hypothetical protein